MLNDVARQQKTPRATVPIVGPVVDDTLDSLVAVLDIVRHGFATTRPEIIRKTGLGRSVVVQRVQELLDRELLFESGLAASSGGRAPRSLQFNARAGHILVAALGATSIDVAVADLAGDLLVQAEEPADIVDGPDAILGRVQEMFDELIGRRPKAPGELWGIGIGLPGPVEFAAGRPVSPPIMPGWDDYPVRARFADRYEVPVWVDNDANLMALGEFRTGVAQGHSASIFLKVGTGIGAGIIIAGRLHRGAQGSAGDVGHIQVTDDPAIVCRCGNIGCLEALAGGAALGRDGTHAARDGRSSELARLLTERGAIDAAAVGWAAAYGDAVSRELVAAAGRRIGRTVATLVNALNPSLVVIGGGVSGLGDPLIAAIRETVYARSAPLATRDLLVTRSILDDRGGRIGAASIVADELFSRPRIATWLHSGSPAGLAELVMSPLS